MNKIYLFFLLTILASCQNKDNSELLSKIEELENRLELLEEFKTASINETKSSNVSEFDTIKAKAVIVEYLKVKTSNFELLVDEERLSITTKGSDNPFAGNYNLRNKVKLDEYGLTVYRNDIVRTKIGGGSWILNSDKNTVVAIAGNGETGMVETYYDKTGDRAVSLNMNKNNEAGVWVFDRNGSGKYLSSNSSSNSSYSGGETTRCSRCGGDGSINCTDHDSNGDGYCKTCKNTGFQECYKCSGSGR